jgi:uncharacterized protein with ATP-grasp and redox domains
LPIPAPLRGAEIGSFAHHTIVVRLPAIARRVLAENDFPPAVVDRLETLIQEIPGGLIRSLRDSSAPDAADWRRYVAPYQAQNWLQVPWFLAEVYFYRRILEATGYFQPGHSRGIDPFLYQKQQGLDTSLARIRALASEVNEWFAQGERQGGRNSQMLARLLSVALWGNQADLSLWPADKGDQPDHGDRDQQQAHLLLDDTAAIIHHLYRQEGRARRVDFIVDNAGFELVCDLCLADYLLSSNTSAKAHFHLKAHPTFVSDAMSQDVRQTVAFLAADAQDAVRALAGRLSQHLTSQRLQCRPHPFWTSPLSGWEMPSSLRHDLAHSHLVISKGDANYRRLLGDRHWSFTAPFAAVVAYFPAPLVALRTLKSEAVVGLRPDQPPTVSSKDPEWLTNGRWGVIQFALVSGMHSRNKI